MPISRRAAHSNGEALELKDRQARFRIHVAHWEYCQLLAKPKTADRFRWNKAGRVAHSEVTNWHLPWLGSRAFWIRSVPTLCSM